MRFNVFGKKAIEVVRNSGEWQVFYLGNEGKKRKAEDVIIPASISESEIEDYISDLFHELATPLNNDVKRL
jgi:hypothetical protein